MTQREQLIQEIEQAPDDLMTVLLETLYRLKTEREHPLSKFAGILSDAEAQNLQAVIRQDCR